MKNIYSLLIYFLLYFVFLLDINAQTKYVVTSDKPDTYKVTNTINLEYKYVPSISEQIQKGTFVPADPNDFKKAGPPKRMMANKVIPGKGLPMGNDPLVDFNKHYSSKKQTKAPSLTFQTTSSTATPGDPTGEIGRDYYLASWNSSFRFFNLDGTPATPAASLASLFGFNESGDPIVLYDSQADRYVISSMGSSSLNFAVSVSNDPVNDGWHVYNAASNQFPTSGQFPDYPKYSIWSDGYYCTTNTGGDNLFVLERDKILNGDTTATLQAFDTPSMATSGFASAQIFDIVDDNHPSAGNATLVYLQDDSWGGVSNDHLKLWTVNVDWSNPSNSSISNPTEIPTTSFNSVFDGGSFSNLEQPAGPDIDAMQATIMNQAQFRKFSTHNSAVLNFVVNTAAPGELAGVRWYELRQNGDGQPWSIFQEGTYTAPDGRHAFGASMSIDLQGNIGMGYSSVSSTESVSLRYTGRYASDPLGQMTLDEGLIVQSTGNSSNLRYADYAHMSVEPQNDKQFWFVSEYFSPGRSHMVGVFQIAADAAYDAGVVSVDSPVSGTLTDNENITVSIFNYGENDISNFDVSFQVDSGAVVTETYTGTIGTGETVQHTFSTTVDMSTVGTTYVVYAYTSLNDDENPANDGVTADITHLNPNDIGVSAILSPTSGELLSSTEAVTVTIINYGGSTQYDFDITYEINGESVTETVSGPLEGNSSMDYTFTQTADLSAFGTYSIYVYTSLDGDSDPVNDAWQASVTNVNCAPSMDCSFGDGFQLFQIADISNESGCEGYGDFTDQSTDLELGETYDVTMTTGWGTQHVRIWIDYNDDFNFTLDELILDNYTIADGAGSGSVTETTQITIPNDANLGPHLMRAKTSWGSVFVPDDACEVTPYGETEDYMVNILPSAAFDIGVTDITNPFTSTLSSAETITIQIFNYGSDNAANFDISYNVNGEGDIIETYNGSIPSGQSVDYSFATTADLSSIYSYYNIIATTLFDGDEDLENDSYQIEIQNLPPIDLGVTEIFSPISGSGLSSSEQVGVVITNFGGTAITNFEVSYTVNGITITEIVEGPLEANSTMQYIFNQGADLSSLGAYEITSFTTVVGDADNSNDLSSITVNHFGCQPVATSGCNVDGIKRFVLGSIDADDGANGCNGESGYVDRTDLSTDLDRSEGNNVHLLQAQHNWSNATGEALSVWIDFNDNGIFEDSERLISGETFSVSGELNDFYLTIPNDAPLGTHTLRAKAIDITVLGGADNILDPCADYTYGEVHDYTVNVGENLSIGEDELLLNQFNIYSIGDDLFKIKLTTDYSELLTFSVYDSAGKRVVFNNIEKTDNLSYIYDLDMSYAANGIYLISMGNSSIGYNTGKIIVK